MRQLLLFNLTLGVAVEAEDTTQFNMVRGCEPENLRELKRKTPDILGSCFIWLRIVEDVRTILSGIQGYIYIPDLSAQGRI